MYKSGGCSIDWMQQNNLSNYSFAVELRDKGDYGFKLPIELIKPTAEEIWNGIKAVIMNL
ncbi:carboxypeptidase A2-like protein [Leptotrombidium deliense]|uniref:Carboxypeptidase A2-like protein n=1 Tax=Leptotrombidium deliense TaxID=299467 RepID=A0A443RV07_9ACAR|nr:carboxypeptidase A2-like protein [Leptotrombidium deliense]